jgi:hypothetical protein
MKATPETLSGLKARADAGHNFAASLLQGYARYGHFTSKQAYWAEKLAAEANAPAPEPEDLGGDLSAIADKFKLAKANGLKYPALIFANIGPIGKTRVSMAPDNGKNPGCLYVKADGAYAGKINPAGGYTAARGASPALTQFLHAFAADPVGVGAAKGKDAGACCFCGRELTDARSLAAGYGGTCAKHWGLPWGHAVELKEAA